MTKTKMSLIVHTNAWTHSFRVDFPISFRVTIEEEFEVALPPAVLLTWIEQLTCSDSV